MALEEPKHTPVLLLLRGIFSHRKLPGSLGSHFSILNHCRLISGLPMEQLSLTGSCQAPPNKKTKATRLKKDADASFQTHNIFFRWHVY